MVEGSSVAGRDGSMVCGKVLFACMVARATSVAPALCAASGTAGPGGVSWIPSEDSMACSEMASWGEICSTVITLVCTRRSISRMASIPCSSRLTRKKLAMRETAIEGRVNQRQIIQQRKMIAAISKTIFHKLTGRRAGCASPADAAGDGASSAGVPEGAPSSATGSDACSSSGTSACSTDCAGDSISSSGGSGGTSASRGSRISAGVTAFGTGSWGSCAMVARGAARPCPAKAYSVWGLAGAGGAAVSAGRGRG